jgi:hypothetical protein
MVVLESDGRTVRKSFPTGARGEEQATCEFERLTRLYRALEQLDGVDCPRPIDLSLHPQPVLRMEFVAGVPMPIYLGSARPTAEFLERLGALLAVVVELYVGAVGEPLYDLHFRNMLYDGANDRVVLLDLGDPDSIPAPFREPRPLDACALSVAGLAGSTLFECARPAHVLRLRSNLSTTRAARAALKALPANHGSSSDIGAAVREIHRHWAQRGGHLRRAWYGTVGSLLASLYARIMLIRDRRGR